jgi:hypothetical protein
MWPSGRRASRGSGLLTHPCRPRSPGRPRSATPSGSRLLPSCHRKSRHAAVLRSTTGVCLRACSGSCAPGFRGAKCRPPTAPGTPPTVGISAGVRMDSGITSAPSCTPRQPPSVPDNLLTVTVVLEGVWQKHRHDVTSYTSFRRTLARQPAPFGKDRCCFCRCARMRAGSAGRLLSALWA